MKRVLGVDDSFDVFPVHGNGGMLGTEHETEGLDTALHGEKGYNL